MLPGAMVPRGVALPAGPAGDTMGGHTGARHGPDGEGLPLHDR